MKQLLIETLRNGAHSLVIERGDMIKTYDTKGVSTLLELVSQRSDLLSGARVVDKIVGKAAAALMILGGVKELYAMLISDGALKLIRDTSIKVEYEQSTPYIINRDKTGWCPMEEACRDCVTPEECLKEIRNKLSQLKGK